MTPNENFYRIREKYGPIFDAMKKVYVLLAIEKDMDGELSEILKDDLGSYERFLTVQQAWGFFEAMLSIPEPSAIKILAAANEEPED